MICRAGFYTHSKVIQAHHLLKPSDGKRGMSLKSGDDQVVPLCEMHHRKLHTKFGSEKKFLEAYGFKETAMQEYAKELWDRDMYQRSAPDDLPF